MSCNVSLGVSRCLGQTELRTTFTVMFRLRCNILSMKTNGLNHAVRVGGEIYPEVYYLQLAHTCTRITSRITKLFAVKPATVHTSSIYTPQSTDGFVVVHLAVSTISGSCGAIGFHSVSLEITHGWGETKKKKKKYNKNPRRSREVLKVSRLTGSMLEEASGYKKIKR